MTISPDQWTTINHLVDWLDQQNGRSREEISLRLLKITEESGEVAQAWIGYTGQNPRKGHTHTIDDVRAELCDVILTAAVALASVTDEPAAILDAAIRRVADRSLTTDQTEERVQP